jgi:hypothetical protein
MPLGSPRTSNRRSAPRKSRRPVATCSNVSPSSRPTATTCERVLQVVTARHLERQPSLAFDRRARAERRQLHVRGGHISRRRREAVRLHPPRHPRHDPRQVRIVEARDNRAVERHFVGEVDERLLQVVEPAVILEVFVVDVRNHRNRRKQFQERSVAFVGLATISSLPPRRALLPNALSRPPITAVGSRPARSSTSAIIDVVVVLPCAPATAIAGLQTHQLASISARGITGT